MKMLISVNPNFKKQDSTKWIESWIKKDEYKLISGFEINAKEYSNDLQHALLSISHYFKKHKWELYLKGPSIDEVDLNLIYCAGRLAEKIKRKVVISYSPSLDQYGNNDLYITYHKLIRIRKIIREHNLYVDIFISNINYLSEGKKTYSSAYHTKIASFNLDFTCDIHKSYASNGSGIKLDLSIEHIHLNKNVYSEAVKYLKNLQIKKPVIIELTQEELSTMTPEKEFQTYLHHLLFVKESYNTKVK